MAMAGRWGTTPPGAGVPVSGHSAGGRGAVVVVDEGAGVAEEWLVEPQAASTRALSATATLADRARRGRDVEAAGTPPV